MLRPYYQNFSKRLVKSPKLYFYDTGLLCYLLGIEDEEGLKKHDLKGNIFETMIISEYLKSCYFLGREPEAYFWRDTLQNEIDLLTEEHSRLEAYEIKLSETMKPEFTKTLNMFRELANLEENQIHCIYRGTTMKTNYGEYKNYLEL